VFVTLPCINGKALRSQIRAQDGLAKGGIGYSGMSSKLYQYPGGDNLDQPVCKWNMFKPGAGDAGASQRPKKRGEARVPKITKVLPIGVVPMLTIYRQDVFGIIPVHAAFPALLIYQNLT